MRPDLHSFQLAAIILVFALIFVSRLAKGRAKETPRGLAFTLKPLVVFARGVALPLYFLLFAYPLWISQRSIPLWLLLLLFVSVLFALLQVPGTIYLTPTAVEQRFWLRADKLIPYAEIMTVYAAARGGSVTRVLGSNRVTITHGFNHAASAEFRTELARRSGKRLSS